jgi:transposase
MDNTIQIPLNLPDVRLIEVSHIENGAWLLRVESTLNATPCRKCGQPTSHFHGWDEPLRLRHLPLFEVPVYIEIRPKRFRCPRCEGRPTTTQQLSWYQRRSPNTTAYEQWLLRILVNSTVSDVSCKLNVSEAIVSGILDRWMETSIDWETVEQIEVIGIDEIALKRGHRDFVALVTTPTPQGVEVLAVLKDRTRETVEDFLKSIPERLKSMIHTVCTDMYVGYVNAACEQLPHAQVVIDRFHVARAYRDCADNVRKQELKRLKQELPTNDYEAFKGLMWTFRQRPDAVSDEDRARLARLFSYSPKLEQAYYLREDLSAIFDGDYTKTDAQQAIQAWCERVRNSEIQEFKSFLTTLQHWLDQITNYFLDRHSSGFVEGFNNRVKVLKRRCYGIFDVKRLFQRLRLDTQGYERFRVT